MGNEWRHFLVEGEHLILELHKAAFPSKKTQQHLQQAELFITEDYSDWVKDKLGDVFRTTVVGKKDNHTKTPANILKCTNQRTNRIKRKEKKKERRNNDIENRRKS